MTPQRPRRSGMTQLAMPKVRRNASVRQRKPSLVPRQSISAGLDDPVPFTMPRRATGGEAYRA